MLAYNLGITKWSNNGIRNRSKRDYKQGQLKGFQIVVKDYKSRQGFQIGAKRFQIGAEITNRGKGDQKPGQRFQIGAEKLCLNSSNRFCIT